MTTKQIAEYLGKPERTVRDWVKALAAKSAVVAAKLAASSPANPADYNLSETCLIIEEGMGKDVADVYRTNAVNAEMGLKARRSYSAAFLREYRLSYGVEASRALLAELGFSPHPPANTVPFPALPAPIDAEYAALRQALGDQGTRTVLAVAYKVAIKHQGQAEADKKQEKLF